ncbi:MAG: cation transporter [Paludibacteraceae bacterium]|jgi:copper chaperone CopZ|nr:cation transporter [Paludibacteraceae bacterium]MBR1716886.1 cation transporter [Paludibacteraceae bacterium]
MKRLLIFMMALLPVVGIYAKQDKKTVLFYVDIHCQGCCDKIMKNIAFEPGVKDIECNIEKKTVKVTYDANKTDVPTLQKAFAKIGKPATTNPPKAKKEVDASTGASTPE